MNRKLRITSPTYPSVALVAATEDNLDQLREWKNNDREFFFHTDVITAEQQKAWFDGYLNRENDYMFIIEVNGQPIGCIGFRYKENQVDIYNVILGEKEMGGKGHMGAALKMLCAFAYKQYPGKVGLTVLKKNPAVQWYKKNGFREVGSGDDYYLLEAGTESLASFPFTES